MLKGTIQFSLDLSLVLTIFGLLVSIAALFYRRQRRK